MIVRKIKTRISDDNMGAIAGAMTVARANKVQSAFSFGKKGVPVTIKIVASSKADINHAVESITKAAAV